MEREQDTLMTVEQVAEALEVKPPTVHTLVHRGRLTPTNPRKPTQGRAQPYLFERQEIERYLAWRASPESRKRKPRKH